MKSFLEEHIIPIGCVLSFVFLLDAWYWNYDSQLCKAQELPWNFADRHFVIAKNAEYTNYADNLKEKWQIIQALASKKSVVLFGSSELTSSSPCHCSRFFRDSLHCSMTSIGHAGNQCMSIMSQLMAFEQFNEEAKIAIIVSPSWFMDGYAKGTALQPFLEYNDVEMLNAALQSDAAFSDALANYALSHEADFRGVSVAIDQAMDNMKYASKPQQGIVSMMATSIRHQFQRTEEGNKFVPAIVKDWPDSACRQVNDSWWNSLRENPIQRHSEKCSNNTWGVSNEYYNEYLKGTKKKIVAVDDEYNQELADFNRLVSYVRSRKMNAVFILQPLNPLAYKNLKEGNATVEEVSAIISNSGYPYLSLFTSDTTEYKKPLLDDVMHFGDYGFLLTNQFIYDKLVASQQ